MSVCFVIKTEALAIFQNLYHENPAHVQNKPGRHGPFMFRWLQPQV
jgi:hypothetical protein